MTEENENIGGIVLRKVKTQGLIISRFPEPTRSEFIEFAEKEFADDYGMLLKHLWDIFKMYLITVNDNGIKLNYIIQLIENLKKDEKKPEKSIKMLSGKKIEKEE